MAHTNYSQLFEEAASKLRECERLLRNGDVSVTDPFVCGLSTDSFFFRHLYELKRDDL